MSDLIALARDAGLLATTEIYANADEIAAYADEDEILIKTGTLRELQAFADLIRKDEREACALVCQTTADCLLGAPGMREMALRNCAAAIRARTTTC